MQAIWFACFIVLLLAGAIGAAWDSCQPKTPTLEEKAEEGDAEAQSMLGFEYELKQDLKEAAKWYRKAAEQGIADAQFRLGVAYANGEGVLEDTLAAYAWYNIAAANGDDSAKGLKDIITKEMTPEQIAEAQKLSREIIAKNPKLIGD